MKLVVFIFVAVSCSSYAKDLCVDLKAIRTIPLKNEKVDDTPYYEILRSGNDALPCLIENVTNIERTPDPRKAPKVDNFVIGDLAYFMIVRITGMEFTMPFPKEVKLEYEELGVYAYFKYVQDTNNRKQLYERLKKLKGSITMRAS
ncbi:hypothetical protein P886_3442 [Alteromonadaceae bacterium 2753L.S.0a.02]|nr:hypothetical protein P886_3442 [Alteromonadaceae bacterium 2753L.S.0a.02]